MYRNFLKHPKYSFFFLHVFFTFLVCHGSPVELKSSTDMIWIEFKSNREIRGPSDELESNESAIHISIIDTLLHPCIAWNFETLDLNFHHWSVSYKLSEKTPMSLLGSLILTNQQLSPILTTSSLTIKNASTLSMLFQPSTSPLPPKKTKYIPIPNAIPPRNLT